VSFCKKKKELSLSLSLFRTVRRQGWRLVNWMKVLAVFQALFRVASPETKAGMSASRACKQGAMLTTLTSRRLESRDVNAPCCGMTRERITMQDDAPAIIL